MTWVTPKSPPPTTITLGVRIQHMNLGNSDIHPMALAEGVSEGRGWGCRRYMAIQGIEHLMVKILEFIPIGDH